MTPKNTVAELATYGSRGDYRGLQERGEKGPHGSQIDYRQPENQPFTVAKTATQIGYHQPSESRGSGSGSLQLARATESDKHEVRRQNCPRTPDESEAAA